MNEVAQALIVLILGLGLALRFPFLFGVFRDLPR